MVENVQTGGVMEFRHEGETGKLDDERKRAIEQGYWQAAERKRREKKRKIIIGVIVVLLVLAMIILAAVFLG